MLKRLALTAFVLLAVTAGTVAVLAPSAAYAKTCPKNSHLIVCPTYSFCCPNNALCVCL